MFFVVRTATGQERVVSELIASRANTMNVKIASLMSPEALKGYIIVEADSIGDIESTLTSSANIKGLLPGVVQFNEIEHYIEQKSITLSINKGDIVELIAGPFKGEKAKVVRCEQAKEELVVELIDATVPIPVTIPADSIRVIERKS